MDASKAKKEAPENKKAMYFYNHFHALLSIDNIIVNT